MVYLYTDIIALETQYPGTMQRVLKDGELSVNHQYIKVPDSFDWHGIREPKQIMTGMGDIFAKYIGEPIAKTIDGIFNTNTQNCGGCKKRKESMNKLIPFSLK